MARRQPGRTPASREPGASTPGSRVRVHHDADAHIVPADPADHGVALYLGTRPALTEEELADRRARRELRRWLTAASVWAVAVTAAGNLLLEGVAR